MSESDFKWINIENIDDIENINMLPSIYDNEMIGGGSFKEIFDILETFQDDLNDRYEYCKIEFRKFPHQLSTDIDLEIYKWTFVNNIIQATNITHGSNDEYAWKALFMCHTDDKTDIFYVWFEARCCYTGFSASGNMTVWMSTDLNIIKNVVKLSDECEHPYGYGFMSKMD
jgi:hypothetical protein